VKRLSQGSLQSTLQRNPQFGRSPVTLLASGRFRVHGSGDRLVLRMNEELMPTTGSDSAWQALMTR